MNELRGITGEGGSYIVTDENSPYTGKFYAFVPTVDTTLSALTVKSGGDDAVSALQIDITSPTYKAGYLYTARNGYFTGVTVDADCEIIVYRTVDQ